MCLSNIPSQNLLWVIFVIEVLGSHGVRDLLLSGHDGVMLDHHQGNTTAYSSQQAADRQKQ